MGEGEETPAPIRLIEGNAKSLRLKSNLEKVFAVAGYFLRPPPLLSFCPGGGRATLFPYTEFKCPAVYGLQHNPTPPFPATHSTVHSTAATGRRMLNLR